jgi:flagellar protein FlaG
VKNMTVNSFLYANGSDIATATHKYQPTTAVGGTTVAPTGVAAITGVTQTDRGQTSDTKTKKDADTTSNKKDADVKKNKQPVVSDTGVSFKLHKGTGTMMIQIIDHSTGKVIKEIPPEKILDSVAQIWKVAGIKVDQKA